MAEFINNTQINLAEIRNENLSCLMKRWNAVQLDTDEAILRFNMTRPVAEALKQLTSDDIQRLAAVDYSLFKDRLNDKLLEMVPTFKTPQEINSMVVIYG